MSEQNTNNDSNNLITEEQSDEPSSNTKLSELEQRCLDLEEQLKRSLADYQNLQRRTQQERELIKIYGTEATLRALLPSFDNFFYAWHSRNNQQEPLKFIDSLKALWDDTLKSLESIGLTYITPSPGDDFDPNQHEAVAKIPSQDWTEGSIVEVLSPGYMLKDRLLKASQVAIATNITSSDNQSTHES